MTDSNTMATLGEIELLAKHYSEARTTLGLRVTDLEDEVRTIKRRRLPGIKTAAAAARDCQAELAAAIQGAPELFVKPRTLTLHGVKVGIEKGKGRLEWDDDGKVIALIRKLLPDQAEVLIVIRETPSKKALANLPAADLRRLGVTVEEAGDSVIIRAADTEIDKLVARLLEEGAVEEVASGE